MVGRWFGLAWLGLAWLEFDIEFGSAAHRIKHPSELQRGALRTVIESWYICPYLNTVNTGNLTQSDA